MLDQLSEGVLLIEPEAQNILSSNIEQQKDESEINSSSYMENANTCAKITYHNNSLLSILNQRGEKRKDIFFGIDVDELLIEMKFKVLFSTNQVRQNLMDYILKIYRSIIDENDALDLVNKKKKRKEILTASVAELFNSFDNNNEDGAGGGDEKKEIFRTYIKIQKTKKVLEMTVQKEVSTS